MAGSTFPIHIGKLGGNFDLNHFDFINDDGVTTFLRTGDAYTKTEVDNAISSAAVGLLDDRGNYNASGNVFPSSGGSGTAGAILKGDLWTISVGGTLNSIAVTAGDVLRALVDTPGQTGSNWIVTENNLGYVPVNTAGTLALAGFSGITGTLPAANVATLNQNTTGSAKSVVGTTTNDDAATGSVGEYVFNTLLVGSAISLTSDVIANITSISLTAGDWDVSALICFHPGATTASGYLAGGISTVSATLGAIGTFNTLPFALQASSFDVRTVVPIVRVSISSTTTVYLVGQAGFTTSTMTGYGVISARRVR